MSLVKSINLKKRLLFVNQKSKNLTRRCFFSKSDSVATGIHESKKKNSPYSSEGIKRKNGGEHLRLLYTRKLKLSRGN